MSKISEKAENRREEIINACDALYKTKNFQEITIKDIGEVTSFSRPSIYNYFQTKEEIFLGLLTREYSYWADDVTEIITSNETLSVDELADKVAKTLEKRITMLKISAMNLYEIEDKSSLDCLKEFKIAFKRAMEAMVECVTKFLPNNKEKPELIQYAFFPFTYGIYPYTTPTDNQKRAMDEVGIAYHAISVYEITYRFLKKILA